MDEIRDLIAGMSVEDKIGQLFVVEVYGQLPDEYSDKNQELYSVDTPAKVVEKYRPGGVIYFSDRGKNLDNPRQIATLSNGLQAAALRQPRKIPLLISTDQEGGVVARLPTPATAMPGNMALAATRSTADSRRSAEVIGTELAALGINQNYAPDADVNVNPVNPVIGVRSFGEDPQVVSKFVASQLDGYRSGGVTTVAKHFPGHGNTTKDSHFGLPEVPYSTEQLHAIDLPPFRTAIAAGIGTIMSAHVVLKSIDPTGAPATMSYPILTGLLRDELRFDGLVVTDALDMKGASGTYPADVAPVQALKAGADLLLLAPKMDIAYDAVRHAVQNNEIPVSRLDESVYRILRLKRERGLFDNPMVDVDAAETIVGAPGHVADARAITDRTTTLIRNHAGLLPLDKDIRKVLVTGWSPKNATIRIPGLIGAAIGHRGPAVTIVDTGFEPTAALINQAAAEAGQSDLVVVATGNANSVKPGTGEPVPEAKAQIDLVHALLASQKPIVAVAVRNPYDIVRFPGVNAYLATYGHTPHSIESLVRVIFGELRPTGRLPVTIPTLDGTGTLYSAGHGLSYPD